jgi:hypothetical protein
MEDMRPQGVPAPHAGPGHEPTTFQIRPLVTFAAALIVASAIIFVVLAQVMRAFTVAEARRESNRPPLFADTSGEFPGPRLQDSPVSDMAALRRDEQAALGRYGWVDRRAGVARIPIDRAMDLLVQKGLPTRKAAPKAKSKPE